jgi:hypothetical protein
LIASAPLRRGSRSQPAYFILPRRRKACPLARPQHGGARSGITWSSSTLPPGIGPADPCQTSSTAFQRRRGAPLLRAAIPLLDKRSESPWESVLRLLHVVADIEVEPQKKIYDEWGNFVARADLWVVGTRRIHEYDGEKHREPDTHRADLTRERRLVEVNVQRVGFTSPQLLHEGASIIAGLDRLLGRTWNPRRLARWRPCLTIRS